MTLSSRIREAMGQKSPADIARATKKTESAVSQWLDGTTKSIKGDSAAMLEAATGYRASWIITGKGEKKANNVLPGPDIRGRVPLISKIQAGNWDEVSDPLQPGEAEAWLPCIATHSTSSYALRVSGDSMTASYGRSYPEGCIIFVDPERKSPANGERIVAKLQGYDEVTFKVYKNEDGRQWLQPLNPLHTPMRDEFSILGTVIDKWEDE